MVIEYNRPSSVDEALNALSSSPGSVVLAGGTFLLAGYSFGSQIVRDPPSFLAEGDSRAAGSPFSPPERVIDIGRLLPSGVEMKNDVLKIGAGCTFQKLAESSDAPVLFKTAALSMANRNIRNRATVGGNLAANKSCSSLMPVFLALDAQVEFAKKGGKIAVCTLLQWLSMPHGILLSVSAGIPQGYLGACMRSSRTACDLATSTVAVVYKTENSIVQDIRIAMGGFGIAARRFPEIESMLEGRQLPSSEEIETLTRPFLHAIADQRGSAEYKRLRGAVLLADALHRAAPFGTAPFGTEAVK